MTCKEFIDKHPNHKEYITYALNTPIEKGKQFSIVMNHPNDERFCRIKVDKGLLKEIDYQIKKCDYTFIRCKESDYYFVELKGIDIETAVQQLIKTITYFKNKYGITREKTYAYIASSALPKSANLKFQKLQQTFLKNKIGMELKRQTNHYKRYI